MGTDNSLDGHGVSMRTIINQQESFYDEKVCGVRREEEDSRTRCPTDLQHLCCIALIN